MLVTNHRLTAGLVASLGLAAITACASDSITATGRSAVTLSFASRTGASTASLASIPITNNGHTLDITSAALNVTKVELHSTKGETESECDDDRDCGPLASQPLVVTLSPTGALVTVNTAVVPAGTYREIEIKVGSVRLVGTYDGRAFDVVLPVNVEREMEFQPPVAVGGADDPARNITIAVPFTTWFTNADGSLVDPAKLATDATLRATVAARVHASFRAFRDDDHDSDDDDHEGGHD